MSDTVRITGVHAEGRHGVHEEEKARPQPFLVDVEAEVEAARAAAGDDLADTVSYADIASDAVAVVRGPSVDLIETLAQRIADRVLARGALRVAVTVHKPEAPVGLPFSDASVTVRRDGRSRLGTIRRASSPWGRTWATPAPPWTRRWRPSAAWTCASRPSRATRGPPRSSPRASRPSPTTSTPSSP